MKRMRRDREKGEKPKSPCSQLQRDIEVCDRKGKHCEDSRRRQESWPCADPLLTVSQASRILALCRPSPDSLAGVRNPGPMQTLSRQFRTHQESYPFADPILIVSHTSRILSL
ncbi:hypothetical protein PoB_002659000 [Plakobranchus ocellatus]|uniref:Uncharacterized protein n=1 Tax=Plakobranchus ocellatus TaxID=259542 RepID=A0AAV3ZW32_9GAST|nr:hypothetical protein PoB_002659000 [Plakobranchus ocellatus]